VLLTSSGEGDAVVRDFIKSPMTGSVVKVFCHVGQTVHKGDALLSVDAMKMEHVARATHDAKVKEVRVAMGDFVNEGDIVITFEDVPALPGLH
jgi:biotin carboxyl carrier protein